MSNAPFIDRETALRRVRRNYAYTNQTGAEHEEVSRAAIIQTWAECTYQTWDAARNEIEEREQ